MATRRPASEPINVGGELVYTAAQVQRLFGVCKSTLREARQKQGLVASRRFGRDWYFESDLLAFLRAGRAVSAGNSDSREGPQTLQATLGETFVRPVFAVTEDEE